MRHSTVSDTCSRKNPPSLGITFIFTSHVCLCWRLKEIMLVELKPNTQRNSRRHFLKLIPTAYKIEFGNCCKMTLQGISKHERSRHWKRFIFRRGMAEYLGIDLMCCFRDSRKCCVDAFKTEAKSTCHKTSVIIRRCVKTCTHGFLSIRVPSLCLCMCLHSCMFVKKQ